MATSPEVSPTQKFMSVWRSPKPVIAQVHGWCVGGGSDFALCADLVVASEDAVLGTPYSRMWGSYLSGMWLYRLGLTKAKEHALTGRPLNGRQAADVGLINEAVPFAGSSPRWPTLAADLASIPSSQLAAMKLIVNQAYENMGLASTQALGPILDGLMRNTPDALASSSAPSARACAASWPSATGASATTPRRRPSCARSRQRDRPLASEAWPFAFRIRSRRRHRRAVSPETWAGSSIRCSTRWPRSWRWPSSRSASPRATTACSPRPARRTGLRSSWPTWWASTRPR